MTQIVKPFHLSPHEQDFALKANVNWDYYSLFLNTMDGWVEPDETWTYVSATTFTTPGDLTTRYNVGDKIRLTQTTAKYFYVTGVSFGSGVTTVTVNGGSDYSLANAAITSPSYSKTITPNGFPQWFNFSTTWTGSGGNPSLGNGTQVSRFSLTGKTAFVKIRIVFGSTTTGGTGTYRFTLPTDANSTVQSADQIAIGTWHGADANAGPDLYAGFVRIHATSSATIEMIHYSSTSNGRHVATTATAPFTWGNTDYFGISCAYEIA